ncbi:MAG: hypothetical protein ACOC4G_11845, partial [Bacillota bacterium]
TTTHSFINAAMARLPYPEISIAVYTVVKGLTNAVKAPVFMFMQIIVSMVDDIKSFKTASKFIWTICGFFFVTLVLMGYTPLGGWVLRNLIGLKDPESIEIAYLTMRITCFLPLVETLRNIYRGLIIGHKRTKISSAATAVRLVVIILFLGAAVKFKFIPGVVAGALAWTGGIGIEGIMVLLGVFYFLGSPGKAARELPDLPEFKQKKLRIMDITTFFLPIALMRFLNSTLNPIVQSGIARSPINATQALAAYGVAFGVMRIIGSPVGYLHHCALVYLKNFTVQRWKKVSRFCLLAGLISSAIIGIIAVSPAGYWILRRIIGVSPEIAENGRWVLLAFSFFPLIQSLRESHWGLLMNRRETRYIGIAKGLNALAVFLVIFGSILVMPEKPLLSPAVLGALAFTAGQGVETIIIRYSSIKNIEQVAEAAGPVETKLGDINIPFIK